MTQKIHKKTQKSNKKILQHKNPTKNLTQKTCPTQKSADSRTT